MKKMNENQLKNHEGGKFWGWTDWDCTEVGAGQCWCTRTYRALWVFKIDRQENLVPC